MKSNLEIAKEAYAAYVRGEIESVVRDYATEDVEYHFPGPAVVPYYGAWRGHAGLLEFFAAIDGAFEILAWEAREFFANDDRIAVYGYAKSRVKATGKVVEDEWMHLLTMRDGKIARLQGFENTAESAAAMTA